MALTKLTSELTTIEQLPDTPNRTSGYTAQQMKEFFDANAKIIKEYINNTLLAEIGGVNGAPNLGIFPSEHFKDGTAYITNIQDALEKLYNDIVGVTLEQLVDGSVTSSKLYQGVGEEAVITAAIRNLAITTAKIANGAVTSQKIADGNINTACMADGAIIARILANSAVTNAKLADGAVNAAKISDASITTSKLADGSVTPAKLSEAVPVANGGTGATTAEMARTNLLAQRQHETETITISVADWNGLTVCTKASTIATLSNDLLVTANPDSFENWRNFGVRMSAQNDGTVTFACVSTPTAEVKANIIALS